MIREFDDDFSPIVRRGNSELVSCKKSCFSSSNFTLSINLTIKYVYYKYSSS